MAGMSSEEILDGAGVQLTNDKMELGILAFPFEAVEMTAENTISELARAVLSVSPDSEAYEIIEVDDWCYSAFLYEDVEGNVSNEFVSFYKGETCFWVVDFCCLPDDYEALEAQFMAYANSVTLAVAE